MKIRLWTIQNEKGWNELQEYGILIPNGTGMIPEFKDGYEWMKLQMKKRIGKPNTGNQYPVWAWYQFFDKDKKRPDLRSSGHLPVGEVGYRMEIEKDEKDILLSDFVLWHTPLCYRNYICDSEEEALVYEQWLETKYPNWHFEDYPNHIKEKIIKSWEKIFDMDFAVPYFTDPFEKKKIQATFWNLKMDEVVAVDKFVAR